jgi:N-acylglucosamine 2-epimerase
MLKPEAPSTRRFEELARQYQDNLLQDVIPFWLENSLDKQNGGYFTCLNRDGKVYDTDKFVWLQARQVWTFSTLYNQVDARPEWLEAARLGFDFLSEKGRDREGNWYFALDRRGRPLVQPYNIFSDCFAAIGSAAYAKAAQNEKARDLAIESYRNILKRRERPKGRFEKTIADHRPLINLALPMILCNVVQELAPFLPKGEPESQTNTTVRSLLEVFLDPKHGLIFEFRAPNGDKVDCFEGRLINPGHGIEAMWFVLDAAIRLGEQEWVDQAVEAILNTLDLAWDREFGGLYYFLDIDGHPPLQLEWNQKLWWVHLETLVALTMAYKVTKSQGCWDWFEKIHNYTWKTFPDAEFGEWYGYADRRGEILLPLKGGKWKGCFHVPQQRLRPPLDCLETAVTTNS